MNLFRVNLFQAVFRFCHRTFCPKALNYFQSEIISVLLLSELIGFLTGVQSTIVSSEDIKQSSISKDLKIPVPASKRTLNESSLILYSGSKSEPHFQLLYTCLH